MGNYNPHAPSVLGPEWVGIRDERLVFSPSVNVLELGHPFSLPTSRVVQDARFYLHETPPNRAIGQVFTASLYPAGTEDQTGPIQSVIIPCDGGAVTGSAVTIANASTVAEAVFDASDNKFIQVASGGVTGRVSFFFNVDAYSAQLSGQRILGVNLRYVARVQDISNPDTLVTVDFPALPVTVENDAGDAIEFGELAARVRTNEPADRLRMGDINHFWSTSLSPNNTADRMPWRYQDLQRFEAAAANRLRVMIRRPDPTNVDDPYFLVLYLALEVLYCEERRVLVGARSFGEFQSLPGRHQPYTVGMNAIPLRTVDTFAANPTLAAGDFLLTLESADLGALTVDGLVIATTAFPTLNALRELYAIAPHPGVQVNIPFPVEDHLGETFTRQQTHVLPQLSVHVSGGAVAPEVHVYGRQAAAPVYSSIFASQEIQDSVPGLTSAPYPQVRWYARRFGDTTVPLVLTSPDITGFAVQITPGELDALPEILDGWREVTRRFEPAPSMGQVTGAPTWRFDAVGETAGNRWEVLGVTAPAVSGVPGNLLNEVPPGQRLGAATYNGAGTNAVWKAPNQSVSTDDPATDLVLLFGQDPPTVTGFALTHLSQPVTGIGLGCGSPPSCIPTGIGYHRATWPPVGDTACDTFTRVVAAGIGTADTGQVWATSGGSAANYAVDGQRAVLTLPTGDTNARNAALPGIYTDVDVRVTMRASVNPTGAALNGFIRFRQQDFNNYYRAAVGFGTDGLIDFSIAEVVAGTGTTLVSVGNVLAYGAGIDVHVRAQAVGTTLRAKVWIGDDEPVGWTLEVTDSTYTSGQIGFQAVQSVGNTTVNPTVSFDDFTGVAYLLLDHKLELQRQDTVDTWQAVMLSSDLCPVGFNDYEARVGVQSDYRIRVLNVYGLAGPWSTVLSNILSIPGVSGSNCDNSVLIFTSNANQAGGYNLAHVAGWEGSRIEEVFGFPEADDVQLRRVYRRDFVTAFHGTERGGEAFERLLLVHAAAIAPERLADFRALRDMAWADLPYVCVRDEIGDRWFASVTVPAGRVGNNRRLYLAPVRIVEVTATPAVVDPSP